MRSTTASASSSDLAVPDAGTARPISIIACLNCSRSSAVAIASAFAPISSTVRTATADHSPLGQGHREVQRGLPAERGKHGVGTLALDDLGEHIGRQRLDVGAIGELWVGHDRRRVRVREHNPIALVTQHPAGLGSRVIELAGLPDDDWPTADDEDRLEIGRDAASAHAPTRPRAARHEGAEVIEEIARASCGPGPASGWYCTLNAGTSRQRSPSTTPSLRFTCVTVGSGEANLRQRRSCGSGS